MKKQLIIILAAALFGAFTLTSCDKDDLTDTTTTPSLGDRASLTTLSAINVTAESATLGGNITWDGGSAVTQKGVCYSSSVLPTIDDSITNDGSNTDSFLSSLEGLTERTKYWVRAYAINSAGTAYGNVEVFTTPCATLDPDELALGDCYQGGLVFYLDGNGGGLIAAPADQAGGFFALAEWGCPGVNVPYSSWVSASESEGNTYDIAANCLPFNDDNEIAASLCANLTLSGYSDWFLPSLEELNLMYENLADSNGDGVVQPNNDPYNIGNFYDAEYWSSSEIGANYAWVKLMGSYGQEEWRSKNATRHVRAIRAF
jgi:hypothetical protein